MSFWTKSVFAYSMSYLHQVGQDFEDELWSVFAADVCRGYKVVQILKLGLVEILKKKFDQKL